MMRSYVRALGMVSPGMGVLALVVCLSAATCEVPPTEGGGQDLSMGEVDGVVNPNLFDIREADLMPTAECKDVTCTGSTPICDTKPPCRECMNNAECQGWAATRMGGEKNQVFCAQAGTSKGACVLCQDASLDLECAASPDTGNRGLTCKNNQCVACTQHSECNSLVCDVYQNTANKGYGRCIPEADVLYVDNKNGACTGGNGSKGSPFCKVQDAINASGAKKIIRVAGSTATYEPIDINAKALTIFGPAGEGGKVALLGNSATTDAVTVRGGGDLTLDGVTVDNQNKGVYGVYCRDKMTKFSLRRSQVIRAGKIGVDAMDCQVRIDRSELRQNLANAINLERVDYDITNTVIADNRALAGSAVQMGSGCTGKFRFNTVARNTSPFNIAGGLDCGSSPKLLEDSIFSGNTTSAGGSQILGCTNMRVVAGTTDSAPGVSKLPVTFKDAGNADPLKRDYRLPLSAENTACCIDKGMATPAVRTDQDGRTRPQRMGYDIGAYELP